MPPSDVDVPFYAVLGRAVAAPVPPGHFGCRRRLRVLSGGLVHPPAPVGPAAGTSASATCGRQAGAGERDAEDDQHGGPEREATGSRLQYVDDLTAERGLRVGAHRRGDNGERQAAACALRGLSSRVRSTVYTPDYRVVARVTSTLVCVPA